MENTLLNVIIGFAGIAFGTTLTYYLGLKSKRQEVYLRIIEKVFEKRVNAHEDILNFINIVRLTISADIADNQRNVITFPACMISKSQFNSFIDEASLTNNRNKHWLNTDLVREMNFLIDYLFTIKINLKTLDDSSYKEIGLVIKQDFIDIAMSLESIAFDFFRSDIYKMKMSKNDEWHKFPKEVTIDRLNNTVFITHLQEFKKKYNIPE